MNTSTSLNVLKVCCCATAKLVIGNRTTLDITSANRCRIVLLRRHYNKCIPSLSAVLSYLNPSKRNLSTRNGTPRRFRKNRRAVLSLHQQRLAANLRPALGG